MATATHTSSVVPRAWDVRIDGRDYSLTRANIPPDVETEIRKSFVLAAGGNRYYLRESTLGVVTCTCQDYIYRKAGTKQVCKHGQALLDAGLVILQP